MDVRDPVLGTCYSSPEKFIERVFGKEALLDENLRIQKAPRFPGSYWIVDSTSSKNDWRYLLELSLTGEFCFTLQTIAFQVTEKIKGKSRIVFVKTRGSGDLPSLEIHYIRNPEETSFHRNSCAEVSFRKGRIFRKPISCENILE